MISPRNANKKQQCPQNLKAEQGALSQHHKQSAKLEAICLLQEIYNNNKIMREIKIS